MAGGGGWNETLVYPVADVILGFFFFFLTQLNFLKYFAFYIPNFLVSL